MSILKVVQAGSLKYHHNVMLNIDIPEDYLQITITPS